MRRSETRARALATAPASFTRMRARHGRSPCRGRVPAAGSSASSARAGDRLRPPRRSPSSQDPRASPRALSAPRSRIARRRVTRWDSHKRKAMRELVSRALGAIRRVRSPAIRADSRRRPPAALFIATIPSRHRLSLSRLSTASSRSASPPVTRRVWKLDHRLHQRVLVGEVMVELRLAGRARLHDLVEAGRARAAQVDEAGRRLDDARAGRGAPRRRSAAPSRGLCPWPNRHAVRSCAGRTSKLDLTVQFVE